MDTASFLRHIWPHTGIYVIAELRNAIGKEDGKPYTYWKHLEFTDPVIAATAVEQFDSQGKTVYHACNSFGPEYEETDRFGKTKSHIRTQQNVVACRSLYDDIDIGKPGCYSSRSEAGAAIKDFISETGLGPLVIKSGNGFHLYWPLTEDVTPEEWLRLSTLKRAVTEHFGLKVDRAADIDSARVLRPVGSHNRKRGDALEVTAMNMAGPYTLAKVEGALLAYIEKHKLLVLPPVTAKQMSSGFDDLSGGIEYPPSSAHEIIKHCATLGHVAMTRGNVSEPVWRGMVGTIKHTVEGEAQVHEWSAGHPDYDYNETQAKIDSWATGPGLCSTFAQDSDHCKDCKHAARIKSPIQLGYITETKAPEIKVTLESGEVEIVTPPYWPAGYHWNGRSISKVIVNEDNGNELIPFVNAMFYPLTRVRTEDGTWGLQIRANPGTRNDRTFIIPTKSVSEPQALGSALASYEVFTVGKNGRIHAMSYLQDFISSYQVAGVETITYPHFGWYDDNESFVLGTTKIDKAGETPVLTGNNIGKDLARMSECSGDMNSWVDLVDLVYNRKGAEAYQFVIAAAFAAPLVEFTASNLWHGIPIALTGGSGEGKTSAMSVACSLYGPPSDFLINAGINGMTVNASIGRFAAVGNLPIILDEMTGRTKEEVSQLLYALSNGRSKIRMTATGEPHPMNDGRWNMLSFISGNEEFAEKLNGLTGQVATASELRVFDIKIPDGYTERVFSGINAKEIVEQQLAKQYGHAGRKWLRFVIKNREQVVDLINKEMAKWSPSNQVESQERFYHNTLIHVVVAARIAKKLGLIRFDSEALLSWGRAQIERMRTGRETVANTPEDYLSQFLASIHGRTIVTKRYGDKRAGHKEQLFEAVLQDAKFKPAARQAIEDRKFFISTSDFNLWCRENNVSPNWIRDELIKTGCIVKRGGDDLIRRESLGKGTNLPLFQTKVYELDYARVVGEESYGGAGGKVIQMPRKLPADIDAADIEGEMV